MKIKTVKNQAGSENISYTQLLVLDDFTKKTSHKYTSISCIIKPFLGWTTVN